jgi:hypothetical protein
VVHDVRRADIRLNRGVLLLCDGIASLKQVDVVVVVAPYVDDVSRAGDGGGGGDINGDVTTDELSSSSSSCSVFDMVWYISSKTHIHTQLSLVYTTRYKI